MDGMWTFLLVGSFGALGAAMAVGTAAALVRYHRRGDWPGMDGPAEVSRGRLVGLYARAVIGAALAGYAFVSLSSAGLIL